ncbi:MULTISPECIES: IS30 family transposase [unclassified Streptomyces]|uniref:IS30 family transposase n=1 Tax=Streptomyces sp. NBC_00119 TaxID=2975659 RepID=A0AAU1U0F2_9ACTN|nr:MULTISPECIES: IS30 family transposase [unclassified Streptomyces]MCX4641404.1 IS30 family transposase [Streptomyces sp. NBC_01446]MCX4648733.1 IS30 family transposase [Streptomyces sp. NBC_01446]MCX4648771.1 IS30 family transposase [Streptomyces sp. NBC_01446]MCX5320538.1 IS30 family transposase [Streptomyces sp. NBC_00120]MCX5322175.1 IS30 family transposase [Streptomyces sp. NBC_00120]
MEFEVRPERTKPQGRKKLTRERAAYFQLMAQGYSNREACRIVGVDIRTGKKWRNGNHAPGKGRRPLPPAPRGAVVCGPSRYLREDERIHIADRLREKATIRQIAAELGRSPSTISREIRRNRTVLHDYGTWYYRPHAAQARADARRPRPKDRKISRSGELRTAIQEMLDEKWSPEQICQALRTRFPDRPEMHVVHETVYQTLYLQGRGELRRELAGALRSGRARRKPRRQAQQRQPRYSHPMVMISDRPAEVEDRAVPGHWEGDLIIGKNSGSAIGTLVERSTRYVMLLHLPADHGAEAVRDALTSTVTTLPSHLARSLTWDQGSEMGRHHEFTLATDIPVYFCDPASPWQRGSNENTNGLLRQYFPKGTDLSAHTPEHLRAVADQLNRRPRKTLGWETPAERLAKLLATAS